MLWLVLFRPSCVIYVYIKSPSVVAALKRLFWTLSRFGWWGCAVCWFYSNAGFRNGGIVLLIMMDESLYFNTYCTTSWLKCLNIRNLIMSVRALVMSADLRALLLHCRLRQNKHSFIQSINHMSAKSKMSSRRATVTPTVTKKSSILLSHILSKNAKSFWSKFSTYVFMPSLCPSALTAFFPNHSKLQPLVQFDDETEQS